MNELEDGTVATIEFGKIQSAAKSAHPIIPVVLQHAETLQVLFVGFANRQAVEETLASGHATLWSTSRDELWRKGATSGDVLHVEDIRINCEQNSLLYLVRPERGGACHTKNAEGHTRPSCYYRRLVDLDALEFVAAP